MWNTVAANPAVQGYRLYYGPNPGTQSVYQQIVGNVTTGQITGLTPGVRYYIVCRAYNSSGESGPSNEVSWLEPASPTPTPTPSPTPTPTPAFVPGDRVVTLQQTAVRNVPGISAPILANHPQGDQGTVVAGPQFVDGWTWYQINYDSGIDGWSSQEGYLAKASAPTPTPTPPPPTPTPTPPPTPTPTPPPTPTPTPTPAPASRYLLSVAGGTGDGFFSPGTSRTINAENPTSQYLFTGWTGPDAALLANPAADTTTLRIPTRNVTVTATYKRR
jgi:uncharacterized repeat protein (TIGR02543 family)